MTNSLRALPAASPDDGELALVAHTAICVTRGDRINAADGVLELIRVEAAAAAAALDALKRAKRQDTTANGAFLLRLHFAQLADGLRWATGLLGAWEPGRAGPPPRAWAALTAWAKEPRAAAPKEPLLLRCRQLRDALSPIGSLVVSADRLARALMRWHSDLTQLETHPSNEEIHDA